MPVKAVNSRTSGACLTYGQAQVLDDSGQRRTLTDDERTEPSMDVAAHLRDLRRNAGAPSIREIEHLIARQGRQQPMARSTIQDKMAGKSPLNLAQVLSIVEALGEHARLNGIPIAREEIDQAVWCDRFATPKSEASEPGAPEIFGPRPAEPANLAWNWEPLATAHMFDVIEFIREKENAPVATWLPQVLREMRKAEMDVHDVIRTAAQDEPFNIVQTLAVLNAWFPRQDTGGWDVTDHNRTVGALIRFTAQRHGGSASPVIVAGLRRAQIPENVAMYLRDVAYYSSAREIADALECLSASGLSGDMKRLLTSIATARPMHKLALLVESFQKGGRVEDVHAILGGIAKEGKYRLKSAFEEFAGHPLEVQEKIALGVPYGKHVEYAQFLQECKLVAYARLVLWAEEEPPF
ncbi:hypothetical protein ACFCWD_36950 [Streptomyces sp. NPDC056374]|uniref:hypothetical protein n=1 Tax=unclassified Streptomyces TaxID=2593676 RepID=UPI0035E14EDE